MFCRGSKKKGGFSPRNLEAIPVGAQNPAPPKTPSNDDSAVNANKRWFPIVSRR